LWAKAGPANRSSAISVQVILFEIFMFLSFWLQITYM